MVLFLFSQLMALDVFTDCRGATRNINEVQRWLDVSIGWTDEKVISSLSPKGGNLRQLKFMAVVKNSDIKFDMLNQCSVVLVVFGEQTDDVIAEVPMSLKLLSGEEPETRIQGECVLSIDPKNIKRTAILLEIKSSMMSTDRYLLQIPSIEKGQ